MELLYRARNLFATLSELESLRRAEKQPLKSARKKLKILLHWGAIALSHASFCATKSHAWRVNLTRADVNRIILRAERIQREILDR